MASLEEIREGRLVKLNKIKEKGINPYPAKVDRNASIDDILSSFSNWEETKKEISIVGRITVIRGQGAILFLVINDGTNKIQIILKKDEIGEESFSFFTEVIDIGDFVSIKGIAMTSKTGEKSILANSWNIASKSLRPLPEKFYGLKDEETLFRQRYLDILINDEVKEMFLKKAKFWQTIRNFLEENGFIEVHTPTLELTTGGAEAEPFETHHNDFDLAVYLRISVGELWQKRLMSAGFPKTYEIGRVYRNEGSSPDHLQEFTNMEFYWAYADYKMGMDLVKKMYQKIAFNVFGTYVFETRGHKFDLEKEWEIIDYSSEIKKQTDIEITRENEPKIINYLKENNIKHQAKTFERLVDVLWKKCRKNISGPAFVVGYPDFMQPLAKRNSSNPSKVEQFQVLLGGAEVGKGYSELNDPIDQKERFDEQQKQRDLGDKEAMMPDYDFIEMLEHGMPPTCGFGAGERLFAFLMNKPIRETQIFPLMKPKEETE